jgi:transposase InsO family protein
MPWKEVKPMDEKVLFLADYLREKQSFTDLCNNYCISRKTGYKWISRYLEEGVEGLHNRTKAPKNHPHQTPFAVRQEIIRLRNKKKIKVGPKKIQTLLLTKYAEDEVPSTTTIYKILCKEGLVISRKRRRRVPPMPQPFEPVKDQNDVWSADYKGQFLTKDGKWCYPLTVMDHQSRYLLQCKGHESISTDAVKKEFQQLFNTYGLPKRIRTDNGVPFASRSVGGISRLSKWWIRLGILPERIQPGKPQQNGAHERMHRTLKDTVIQPPGRNIKHQQKLFDGFMQEYNNERPHETLKQKTPASQYQKSFKQMPTKLPELEYPGYYRITPVSSKGLMYCFSSIVYVGHILEGERVGMEEVHEGVWKVYFGPIYLGLFDQRDTMKNKYGYCSLKV